MCGSLFVFELKKEVLCHIMLLAFLVLKGYQ